MTGVRTTTKAAQKDLIETAEAPTKMGFNDWWRVMAMKRLIAVAGAATAFLYAASAVTAESRDSVERGQRMDTDAILDDVRTNRLQIPEHSLTAQQSPPRAPGGAIAGDGSARNTNAGLNRRQRIRSSRRPHMHAMPRGMSDRQKQLRQQQDKSR